MLGTGNRGVAVLKQGSRTRLYDVALLTGKATKLGSFPTDCAQVVDLAVSLDPVTLPPEALGVRTWTPRAVGVYGDGPAAYRRNGVKTLWRRGCAAPAVVPTPTGPGDRPSATRSRPPARP